MPNRWDGNTNGKPFADHGFQMMNYLGVLAPMCDGAALLQKAANTKAAIDGEWESQHENVTGEHVNTISR